MKLKKQLCFGALALVLGLAGGLLYSRAPRGGGGYFSSPLRDRLPVNIDGWVGAELPLGENEAMLRAVDRLNYTDYIFRSYTKGGEEIVVYAMFWREGRISVREMAGHIPDNCWVANGAAAAGHPQQVALHVSRGFTKKGELRQFAFPRVSYPVHVIWWHLCGGEIVPTGFGKSPFAMITEAVDSLSSPSGRNRDQLFIRIHSKRPLSDLAGNPVVEEFLSLFSWVKQ
jgi:hypothetical protein